MSVREFRKIAEAERNAFKAGLDAQRGGTRRLVLDFPLREDFAAQVVVPYTMTLDEARRLAAFIQAIPPMARDLECHAVLRGAEGDTPKDSALAPQETRK